MNRIGILGSTRGTVMLDIFEAIRHKQLNVEISLVLSNKQNALILENAQTLGSPSRFLDPKDLARDDYDTQLSQAFEEANVELIILIGYMRLLSSAFLKKWENKVINVHPSLLPAHAGLIDMQVHQAVLDAREKQTGCTIHYVTEKVDAGPIILQEKCIVLPTDTVERLKARVQALEGVALIDALKKIFKKPKADN